MTEGDDLEIGCEKYAAYKVQSQQREIIKKKKKKKITDIIL